MTAYRSMLMAGVCLGLMSLPLSAQETTQEGAAQAPAWAAEATMNPDYEGTQMPSGDGAPSSPVDTSSSMVPADPGEAGKGEPGVTTYFGDTMSSATAPFSAEAAMNPDYSAEVPAAAPEAPAAAEAAPAAEAPAPQAEAEAVAPADPGEAGKGEPGTTIFYGDTASSATAPFAAEAQMNPDYKAEEPAPAPAAEAPAAAAEAIVPADPGEAPKGVPGVTEYYGDTKPSGTPAWAAEATMMPETPAAAAAAPATEQAVEACRDALNAEAGKGSILFASSKWDVLAQSYKTLDKLAKIAKDCGATFVIEVGGHTDNVGKPAANKTISELRAKAVVTYLTRAGVAAGKLKAVGYGQDKPIADNATATGRAKNRRIEFMVQAN